MSADYIQPILDPEDPEGPRVQAVLPGRLISYYYKFHPVNYENLRAAKFVLEHPKRLFAGIRAFNEGGWCFTGRPETWHIREDVTAPFPANLVFAVYLNSRCFVYEC